MKTWLETTLARLAGGRTIAKAIRYALSALGGLIRFLDDGRIEIDSNIVERSMRPIALNERMRCSPAPTRALHTAHLIMSL